MRHARTSRTLAIACLVFIVLTVGTPGLAQQDPLPLLAPRNRAFVNYFAAAPLQIENGGTYGLIPVPVDLSHAKGKRILREGPTILALPSAYDLRTANPPRLPPVRNQGSCGSCWAFAAYGSLESCLLPGESADFSENHLKNTHGFDWGCCEGGNHWIATAYLARWSGPVSEASDPYNAGSCTSPSGIMPIKHVHHVDYLPDRANSLDNDNIKQAVMLYGAVYTTLYMTGATPYFNQATQSLYYTGSNPANHAVCIVGWDDNYSRTKFYTQPPGDGAFIVRNSWGSSWGLGGYFWVSYYDTKIGRDNAVFISADSPDNYNQVYEYDPYGWVISTGYPYNNTAWFANVFTASSNGDLRAVSFYTASPGSTYEVYVYLNPNSGPINTAGYQLSASGTIAAMGYHTISLPSSVPLTAGQRFSIVVKLTTPGFDYPIPIEEPYSGYSSGASASAGQSYISLSGTSWSDITTIFPNRNVCLKAFTTEPMGLLVSPGSNLASDGPVGGPFSPQGQVYTLTNIGRSPIAWTASASDPWISLSEQSGTIGAGGSTTVTVFIDSSAQSLPAGIYSGTVTFTNTTNGIGNTSRQVELNIFDSYEIRPTLFRWIDPSNHVKLTLGDDGVSAAQSMPFSFTYYGRSYSQIYVAANGMVGFAADGLSAYQNVNIPNTALPNAMLCPYWDDLNPEAGGNIYIGTIGAAPNRILVVSWVGVPHWSSSTTPLTFQVCLYEGSGDIVFQYLDVKPENLTFGAGRSATIGIESASGTAGTLYSFNGSMLLTNGTALLFTSRGVHISAVKGFPAETRVSLKRAIVTAAFDDVFYIESDDRMSGIRVLYPSHNLMTGMRANVLGLVRTNADGERYIEAESVSLAGVGSVTPVAIRASMLGGNGLLYDPELGTGQQGTKVWQRIKGVWTLVDVLGPNNIGLLVKTWGRVTYVGTDTFFVDDGSGLRDDSGHIGVRVYAPGLILPPVNSYITLVGISSCFKSEGVVYRRLLVSKQSDITVL